MQITSVSVTTLQCVVFLPQPKLILLIVFVKCNYSRPLWISYESFLRGVESITILLWTKNMCNIFFLASHF
jgi:hypothetical protein